MSRPTHRSARAAAAVALLTLVLAVAACSRGGKGTPTPTPTASASPTATPTVTASPTPTATPVTSLRQVNFEAPAIAGELIRRAGGGEVHQNRVLFADLTGNGVDEAVAIVDSGGTAGEIGAGVFRLEQGRPVLVQFIRYQGRLEIQQGLIMTLEGVYAPGDPESSPSKLHEITYKWDGSKFVVFTDQVIANPSR